jgi:hypothetical protein
MSPASDLSHAIHCLGTPKVALAQLKEANYRKPKHKELSWKALLVPDTQKTAIKEFV